MKEFVVVIWNLEGKGGSRAAIKMLTKCDLRTVAQQESDKIYDQGTDEWVKGGSFGSVRLAKGDPRLKLLLAELKLLREKPITRIERVYSRAERESSPWATWSSSTTMVTAGRHQEQAWDLADACPTCGAGAVPVPPLIVKFEAKKTAGLCAATPFGLLLMTSTVGNALKRARLTGFELEGVRTAKSKTPDATYRWFRITSTWPRYSKRSVVRVVDTCPACDRPGRFSTHEAPPEIHYGKPPHTAMDFNLTFEQWGNWKRRDGSSPRGAEPLLILSQRARAALANAGVKLQIEPIFFPEGPLQPDTPPAR